MKAGLLLLLLVLFFSASKAQDTIFTRGGKILKVRVVQAGPLVIEYKKADSPETSIKVIRTKDVFAIRYQSGKKDVFMAMPREYHGEVMSDYDRSIRRAKRNVRTGIGITCLGTTLFSGGAIMVGVGIDLAQPKNGDGLVGFMLGIFGGIVTAAGLGPSIIGPIFISRGKKQQHNARQLKPELSLSPVGIGLKF